MIISVFLNVLDKCGENDRRCADSLQEHDETPLCPYPPPDLGMKTKDKCVDREKCTHAVSFKSPCEIVAFKINSKILNSEAPCKKSTQL